MIVPLIFQETHLKGIFDEQGNFVKAVNLVDDWLKELDIQYSKSDIKGVKTIELINMSYNVKVSIGSNYIFENPKDAMFFKLRWRE